MENRIEAESEEAPEPASSSSGPAVQPVARDAAPVDSPPRPPARGKRSRSEVDELALDAVNTTRRMDGLPPLARLQPPKKLRAVSLAQAITEVDHELDEDGDSEAIPSRPRAHSIAEYGEYMYRYQYLGTCTSTCM